jgi:hypothetical protein
MLDGHVPTVRCASVTGLETWFNSRDHLPPHFHAERVGQWEVRVMFMRQPPEFEPCWGCQPSGRDQKRLRSVAERHRLELLSEWEQAVCIRGPGAEE